MRLDALSTRRATLAVECPVSDLRSETDRYVAGVPLSVVSRTAGHEAITTTVDLYGHVSEDATRDAVEALSRRLGLAVE
jgi:hypothetical protein